MSKYIFWKDMKSARPKWISTKIRWFSSFYIYKLIQLTHGILIKILHSLSTLNLAVIEIVFSVWTCLDKCGMSEKNGTILKPFTSLDQHAYSLYWSLHICNGIYVENLSTNSELFWGRLISLISWPLWVIIFLILMTSTFDSKCYCKEK